MIRSSGHRRRARGASALPAIVPIALAMSITPNHPGAAWATRSQNAMWKVRNPTIARSSAIADAAITTEAAFSSARSSAAAGAPATTSRGSARARTAATPNTRTDSATVAPLPTSCSNTAGTAATKPTTPDVRPSLAFASTSSSRRVTTVGTTALFDTRYAFDSTRLTSASGNSARLSMCTAIARLTSARAPAMRAIVRRRPPGIRSIAGATSGASTVNGAIVMTRKRATRHRAARGSVSKNTEPARATATIASPAAIAACVRASRVNGDGRRGATRCHRVGTAPDCPPLMAPSLRPAVKVLCATDDVDHPHAGRGVSAWPTRTCNRVRGWSRCGSVSPGRARSWRAGA